MLNELLLDELMELLQAYDEYIQRANENDLYWSGWKPVCIEEFAVNEYALLKGGNDE